MFASFAGAKGQDYTTKEVKIKFDEKDTVWIVNANYNFYKENLQLTLDFSEQDPKPTLIKWNASDAQYTPINGSTKMTHTYPAGKHELQLISADGKVYSGIASRRVATLC